MFEAITYNHMMISIKERYIENLNRTICILIARPSSPFVKKEILSNIEYFHHRSGNHVDF